MQVTVAENNTADVIVVGAGPGGSTTAAYLAAQGRDVLLLEKTAFPREKVCGDGLTPRAVAELDRLGISTPAEEGWIRNHGLRIIGGGMRLELPWPELSAFPGYGLVRTRQDFDQILARHAQSRGARLHERTTVTGALRSETGRVVGVTAKGADGEPVEFRAPVVVAADGNSSRLSLSVDRPIRDDRPMGVAVRTYYRSPRHDDDWLESWLELWSRGDDGRRQLLPGYGWVFGVGDGTSNVGLGILNTSSAYGKVDYRDVLARWVAEMPGEWEFNQDTQVGPVRGAALPMAFNRQPLYADGLLLIGDAGGMVNPFNGEGIAYAMQSARVSAEVVDRALSKPTERAREGGLQDYPEIMRDQLGGYYQLGGVFAQLIGRPQIMKLATDYGLPRPLLMKFVLKMLANLTEPRGGDVADRIINGLSRITPAA